MRGCVVIHGLTGTPATVACISQALITSGFRVSAPCLAGHGGTLEELDRSTWQQWYETVHLAYMTLRRECEKVYFAGISLGSLLGLKLALDEGWGVRALALMSTPLLLSPWNRVFIPIVRYTPLRFFITSVAKNPGRSVADPEGRRLYMQQTLPRIPQGAAFQMADLQRELRHELHRLSNPLLLLHARRDLVSPYSNVALIRRTVASKIVETATFARSRHVITMDIEKDLAANAIVQFFKRFP